MTSQSRRRLLQAVAASAVYSVPGLFAEALKTTAGLGEGPFYPDKMPLDTDNDLLVLNEGITPAVKACSRRRRDWVVMVPPVARQYIAFRDALPRNRLPTVEILDRGAGRAAVAPRPGNPRLDDSARRDHARGGSKDQRHQPHSGQEHLGLHASSLLPRLQ